MPEGYNSRHLAFMRLIVPSEPLDLNDVEEMERRFDRYLQLCEEWDMRVGNMAAYVAIGITKDQANDFLLHSKLNPSRCHFIKKVMSICAMYREALMSEQKVNPAVGIFWQKNFDSLRDQTEMVVTAAPDPLGEQRSMQSLEQKYMDNAQIAIPESTQPDIVQGVAEEILKNSKKVAEGAFSENP